MSHQHEDKELSTSLQAISCQRYWESQSRIYTSPEPCVEWFRRSFQVVLYLIGNYSQHLIKTSRSSWQLLHVPRHLQRSYHPRSGSKQCCYQLSIFQRFRNLLFSYWSLGSFTNCLKCSNCGSGKFSEPAPWLIGLRSWFVRRFSTFRLTYS